MKASINIIILIQLIMQLLINHSYHALTINKFPNESIKLPLSSQIIHKNQIEEYSQRINISMKTKIYLENNSTSAVVTELIEYELTEGKYNNYTHIISLEGTADKIENIKVVSNDLILKNAYIQDRCFTNGITEISKNYICVFIEHEVIQVNKIKIIKIGLEYNARNIIRRREKPFSSDEEENILIWNIDNTNSNYKINKFKISYIISKSKVNINEVLVYPDVNILIKDNKENGSIIISNNIEDILNQEYQKVILIIPSINSYSKQFNEINLKVNAFKMIKVVFGISITIFLIFFLIYIILSKNDLNRIKLKKPNEANDDLSSLFNIIY